MAKYAFVNFKVTTSSDVEELYLVGNLKDLGSWNYKKALKMNKLGAREFSLRKRFLVADKVEYKILGSNNWENVEKGMFNEDVENHSFEAEKGHYEDIFVHHIASKF